MIKRVLTVSLLLLVSASVWADRPVLGVADFTNEVTGNRWWSGDVGRELSGMLANELAAIGAFTVVERTDLEAVMQEQDLGASGRVREDTAAQIGELTGADYIVLGTVTAYSEETRSTGGGISYRGIGIGGKRTEAYIAVDVRFVDANTGELAHVRTIEGRTQDGGINLRARRSGFGGSLSHEDNTPVGEAIRAALIGITDYAECALVLQDRCMHKYDQKEEERRERTRSRLRF